MKNIKNFKDFCINEENSFDLHGYSLEDNLKMSLDWIKTFGGKDLLIKKEIYKPWQLVDYIIKGKITIEEIDNATKGNHGQKDGASFSETPLAKKFFIPYIHDSKNNTK